MSKKIPKAASKVFEGASGSGMSPEERARLAPAPMMAAPKAMHPLTLQIHSYVPKTTAAERAASAKETLAKKAAKAIEVASKKAASLQKATDKELLRQKKAMAKAFK